MKRLARIILINFVVLSGLFAVAELVYSSYFYFNPLTSVFILENAGKTLHFDPIKGLSLTTIPTRFARITRGKIEFIGTQEGNAQGFPDRDDFTSQRPTPETRRYAVFGDSFSAGQYISRNWPDRVEDFFTAQDQSVQLLNFSGSGWGLGNWANIIQHELDNQKLHLDGSIFAIWHSDLSRRFYFTDLRNRDRYFWSRARDWDPDSYPKSLEEANEILDEVNPWGYLIVSTEEFNEILKGKPVGDRIWKFELTNSLISISSSAYQDLRKMITTRGQNRNKDFKTTRFVKAPSANKKKLYDVVKSFAQRNELPILVVYIWRKEALFDGEDKWDIRYKQQCQYFADYLGADFIDGEPPFKGLARTQLQKLWLPNDGHWGQGGSDVFAGYMMEQIKEFEARHKITPADQL